MFEFVRTITLRPAQVRLIDDFMKALQKDNLDLIEEGKVERGITGHAKYQLAHQMLMGQGKTAVITPLLCLLLADGTHLPIVMLPVRSP